MKAVPWFRAAGEHISVFGRFHNDALLALVTAASHSSAALELNGSSDVGLLQPLSSPTVLRVMVRVALAWDGVPDRIDVQETVLVAVEELLKRGWQVEFLLHDDRWVWGCLGAAGSRLPQASCAWGCWLLACCFLSWLPAFS